MHWEAHSWVEAFASTDTLDAVEFGARDINGSIQPLFPNARWTGVDIAPGPRVDVVANAATYQHPTEADLVVCCEVFEHTPEWRSIIANAHRILASGGMAVFTCAGRNRPPHSAVDGGGLRPDEYYANVHEDDMQQEMERVGFTDVRVEWIAHPGDVRAFGRKP